MKKTKILTVALLLATLAGCSKDNDGRIRIFAEKMSNNTKVLVNPENISAGAQWVVGEYVKLNGVYKTIQKDETSGAYYLDDTENMTGDKVAYYPGKSSNKYGIDFVNDTMFINSLSVIFRSGGQHEIAFPMVATAGPNENQLGFRHLTGGFRVTLKKTSASSVSVARVRVIAQNTAAVEPLYYKDVDLNRYYAKWAAPMGPSMPLGENLNVKYCSVMNFDLYNYNENNPGVSFSQTDERKFCIPITVSSVKNLYVTGYDDEGTELFSVKKVFTSAVEVERNHMYDIHPIEF